jgi:hypothetical protein
MDYWKDARPVDLAASNGPCHVLLRRHNGILRRLEKNPASLIPAAIAHCATLSASKDFVPTPGLFLGEPQSDPHFFWAPPQACNLVFKWARNVFVAQLAANIKPFAELPDDCTGDVLEHLEMAMTRTESQRIIAHCSSPGACAWVRVVVAAAAMVRLIVVLLKISSLSIECVVTYRFLPQQVHATDNLESAVLENDIKLVQYYLTQGANIEVQNDVSMVL